jgi:hypothetical protein
MKHFFLVWKVMLWNGRQNTVDDFFFFFFTSWLTSCHYRNSRYSSDSNFFFLVSIYHDVWNKIKKYWNNCQMYWIFFSLLRVCVCVCVYVRISFSYGKYSEYWRWKLVLLDRNVQTKWLSWFMKKKLHLT